MTTPNDEFLSETEDSRILIGGYFVDIKAL